MTEVIRAFLPGSTRIHEFRESTPLLAEIRLGLLNGLPGVVAERISASDVPPASAPGAQAPA